LLAQWSEIDFGARLWTIPADRMKAGKPHRVPLSDAAMEILQNMRGVQQGDFVFPGMKPGRPLSNMALLTLLDRMDYAGITSHGFRSTFRDWAGEHAKIPREVAEAALAHVIKDKSEAAYTQRPSGAAPLHDGAVGSILPQAIQRRRAQGHSDAGEVIASDCGMLASNGCDDCYFDPRGILPESWVVTD
jgi:hypothetical protein